MSMLKSMPLFCALMTFPAFAQQVPAANPADAEANVAYTQKQWSKAEPLYAALTQTDPDNARFWFRYATAARGNGHYALALHGFERAKIKGTGKGLPPYVSDFEIASTYAAKGDAQQALDLLKVSTDAGYSLPERLENDTEWSSLRGEPRFVTLLKQVKHNAAPCQDTPEAHQFDFWVGDWDVVSASGGPQQGTSHISSEMGSCVIWENWTSLGSPYFGKSYNTYNTTFKRWEQYWVDNSAGATFYHGNLKDGVMDYYTDELPQPNGTKVLQHLQFFELSHDKVRQFNQTSTDEGKTWTVVYDFIYNRHKPDMAAETSVR